MKAKSTMVLCCALVLVGCAGNDFENGTQKRAAAAPTVNNAANQNAATTSGTTGTTTSGITSGAGTTTSGATVIANGTTAAGQTAGQTATGTSQTTPKSGGGGGGSIFPWVIGAAVVAGGVILATSGGGGDSCSDSEMTKAKGSDPASFNHQNPFELAFTGYRGQLGFGGYGAFCDKILSGEINANHVVEAGIARGYVSRRLANCQYRRDVKSQTEGVCNN